MLGRLLWHLLGATFSMVACSRPAGDSQHHQQDIPQRGDLVLIESSAAQFYEARIIGNQGPRVRVQSVVSGDMRIEQAGNVYALPPKTPPLAARSYAICNIRESFWVGCRVSKSESDGAEVKDAQDHTHRLPWNRVLIPGALTELNLKRLFEKATEQADFEREIAKAGNPHNLPGWHASTGKVALARLDGSWRLGLIVGERRSLVRVQLLGTKHEVEVPREAVAAEPPYPLELVQKSRLVLLRPSNQTDAWRVVRLVSADALESTIEDYEHGRRVVPARDICPLQSQ